MGVRLSIQHSLRNIKFNPKMIEEIHKLKYQEDLLAGKTVVITGAGSGIGREIAKTFSDHGADLILLSKDAEKLNSIHDEIDAKDFRAMKMLNRKAFENLTFFEKLHFCL